MNRYDLVLLGLIKEQERSGYDIMTEIKNRELDRWAKISTSTIYNRLTRLEKNGSIEGHPERDGNRPERTVYRILEKGSELLKKEVLRHLTGFNDDPRTLGYAFLYAVDPIDTIRVLEVHEKKTFGRNLSLAEDDRRRTSPDALSGRTVPQLHEPRPHYGGTQVYPRGDFDSA